MTGPVERGTVKLLDLWNPPDGAGEPLGCLATTYTFDTVFYEEECLGRFVQIESDPAGDGPAYLIEREEKLAGLMTAAVYVDQGHCIGTRSIRWDMIAVRPERGSFHPKITLLCWQHHVRLMIGSANLSVDGYRRNQEIMGVLEYGPEDGDAREPLEAVLSFFTEIHGICHSDGPEIERATRLLRWTADSVGDWGAGTSRARGGIAVAPVLVSPSQPDIFRQLLTRLPGSPRPTSCRVTSPFYSETADDKPYLPATSLWNLMNQRGNARVTYCIPAEMADEEAVVTRAPIESMCSAAPTQRQTVETNFEWMPESVDVDGTSQNRPFHLKSLWFESDSWMAHLIGSSNFTVAGTGLARNATNFEANLLYVVRGSVSKATLKEFANSRPEGAPIDHTQLRSIETDAEEAEPESEIVAPLPPRFRTAVFGAAEEQMGVLELTFNRDWDFGSEPETWEIREPDTGTRLYSIGDWVTDGRPKGHKVELSGTTPPSGLEVSLGPAKLTCWWPVILRDATSLPPPDELRNIPLSLLIAILTSARPVHQIIGWLRHAGSHKSDFDGKPSLDALKNVDDTSFILQRTRRVSWAIEAMRKRLEKPVVSREQLEWRLKGPIGIIAFVDAVTGETDGIERLFVLAEIAIELKRVSPVARVGCLPPEVIRKELHAVARHIVNQIETSKGSMPKSARRYLQNVMVAAGSRA